jgi:HlyD family secretion protein
MRRASCLSTFGFIALLPVLGLTISCLHVLTALGSPVATAKEPSEAEKSDAKADEPTPADASTKKATTPDDHKSAKKDEAKPKAAKTKNKNGSAGKPDKSKDSEAAAKKDEAATKSDDKSAKSEDKRKTYKVEPKRFKIDLSLEGTFTASKMEEVPLRPDSWTEYEIVEVAELGSKVHKGERLFKFDADKINDAIEDLELEQRLSELSIMRSEEELPRTEKTLKMDFEDADRSDRQAREDFQRYNDSDRPMSVKSAEFLVKYYNFNLDYEKDELDQLEKMYKADDLTEKTEEIILKRQKSAVEFAKFSLENAKLTSEEMLKIRLPRMDIQLKESLERTALAKARAKMALSLDLDRTRDELEQRKNARKRSLEKRAKLLADRELMELKSPVDGVVYYGQCVNGRFAETASLITKYQPHNNVTGGSVLMTIVQQRPLYITSTLDEGKRPDVSDDQKAKIALPSEPGDRVGGKVKSISPIPVSSGKFEIDFDVDQDEVPSWIVAGMSCKINVTTYDKEIAIVVPKKSIHDDEYDPDSHFVWLVDKDDADAKPKRHDVKLGKRKDDEIEIVKGLKKGDVVSLEDESDKTKKAEDKD